MQTTNEIITSNARIAIETAIKDAAAEGRRRDERTIAAQMAGFLELPVDTVQKGLTRYLRRGHVWKVNYVEALARAVCRDVSWMVEPHSPADTRRAIEGSALRMSVDSRLSRSEAIDLGTRLRALLDRRPLFVLALRICDLLLEARSVESAALALSDEVRRDPSWIRARKRARPERAAEKKSKK